MGKAENIKRAKKLKEAKRKKEQEAYTAQGIGPAGMELHMKHAKAGTKVVRNQSNVKYSNLLAEFVQPILEEEDSVGMLKGKFYFGMLMWNSVVIKEHNQEAYADFSEEFIDKIRDEDFFEILSKELIERKKEYFSQYTNIITGFNIKKINSEDFDISVTTTPVSVLKKG